MLKLAVALCVLVARVAAHPLDGSRIVNGTNAKAGEIPYIVSLRNSNSHSCGGSILDKNHILTAAHCIDGQTAGRLSIQYGVLNIKSSQNLIPVQAIYKHEGYAPSNNYANDVAVLKLAKNITFGQNAQPVQLPKQGEVPPGGNGAVLAGWGYNQSGGTVQADLKRVNITLYTDANCKAAHGSRVDARYHICAGVPQGGKGQCSGDSGGPLNSNGKQWGVVSWSIKPCARPGLPGVFARVPSYINWIKSKQLL